MPTSALTCGKLRPFSLRWLANKRCWLCDVAERTCSITLEAWSCACILSAESIDALTCAASCRVFSRTWIGKKRGDPNWEKKHKGGPNWEKKHSARDIYIAQRFKMRKCAVWKRNGYTKRNGYKE